MITIYKLACAVVLGFIPEDIDLELPDLRVLSAEQVENIKDKKFNRLMQAWNAQLLTEEQFKDACNKEKLLPVELDPKEETVINMPGEEVNPNEKPKAKSKKEKQNSKQLKFWGQNASR